tara:strand:- start:522 stop:1403 length:882 start_codon:yes stop_codon:yes gene_type:complete
MSRCLITGHRGFIGSHLYRKLVANASHDVIGIDKDDIGNQEIVEIFTGQRPKIFAKIQEFAPEYIFHLAALPRIMTTIEQPVHSLMMNILASSLLLDFSRQIGTKRFIFSSSSSVVGNGNGPTNPYALHKLTTEHECRLYSELYDCDTVSLRYFNVYAPDQPADGPYATAICNWMEFIRQKQNPFITGDGIQRRDMIHVDDVVDSNIFAMNHAEDFGGAHYDVGTGKNMSLNEMRKIVEKIFPDVVFETREDRPNEVSETLADTNALLEMGWSAKISPGMGIKKCFKELKKNI